MKQRINLEYLTVDDIDFNEIKAEIIKNEVLNNIPKVVMTPNAGHLKEIMSKKDIEDIYLNADYNLIDGWPIALAASIRSRKKVKKVTGSDLTPAIFSEISAAQRVGIFGGKNEVKIREVLQAKYPNLNLQLINCDNWSDSVYDVRKIRELIQFNALSIVILSLGHPKQEKIAIELKNFDWVGSRPNWILCFGASVDFLVGDQKRAPRYFQKLGLEWLFRLINDPKKFSNRYVSAIFPSIKLILKSIILRFQNE